MLYTHRLDRRFSLKFHESYLVWQTSEGDWRAQWLNHCDYNSKDEDISLTGNKVNKE